MNNLSLQTDEYYIKKTLPLAAKARGFVSPNPLVGALLVNNGQIISKGYHKGFGQAHAEIDCLNKLSEIPANSTLYINLEPCNHFGKTPPCTDAILKAGISRVVIGTLDPNPIVQGKGVEKLETAGVEVKTGLAIRECQELNKFFFKGIVSLKPYITLKTAQTIDGKLADTKHNSKWISSEASRKLVHKLRAEYDAVLVGAGTLIFDNPKLDVRLVKGRNPARIIFSPALSISSTLQFFSSTTDSRTYIITGNSTSLEKRAKEFESKGAIIIKCDISSRTGLDLTFAMKELYRLGIGSVFVEGGSKTFSAFLSTSLVDEIMIFTAPKILGSGFNSFSFNEERDIENTLPFLLNSVKRIGNDTLSIYRKLN